MIVYFWLSKQMYLCIAIGVVAFSCHNAINQKIMLTFVKKCQNHKILSHYVETLIFKAI